MTTEDTASTEEYNGWPNRETWAASLHLSNDYGLYTMVNGWANDARREAIEDAERDEFDHYKYGTFTVERSTVLNLAEMLEGYIAELRADIADDLGDRATETERAMVLEIGSDWRVDWQQVAENWLEDFEFEGEES